MKRKLQLISTAFFVFYVTGLAAQSEQDDSVDYLTVGLASVTPVLSGFTTCRAELELAFAVSGLVRKTFVSEGQVVKSGETLMTLDQEIERIDVQRRQAITEDDAELRSAVARMNIASQQMQSAERIYSKTGGISLEEVQNRTLAFKLAEIEISRLQAQARLNFFDYETAHENLARRTLTAPSNGIISKIEIQTGESAKNNEPVMILCDLSQLEFISNIPVGHADRLIKGMAVQIEIISQNTKVKGKIKFISPVVDSASGLQQIKVVIDDTADWLRPGMNANLVINP